MPRKVRVAVLGSGLAGLTAAYLLINTTPPDSDVEFEVHLFEKSDVLGMDSSSVSLPIAGGDRDWRIDVPMRSFQGGYYPQLIAFYKRLGVSFRETDFTYSFSLLSASSNAARDHRITATMLYNGSSGLGGLSMPSILKEAYRSTKDRGPIVQAAIRAQAIALFLLMVAQIMICYIRMLYYSSPLGRRQSTTEQTFADWAEKTVPTNPLARWTGLDVAWRDYTQTVLVPLFSAVCTAPEEAVQNHPVEEILDYIWLTLGTHHYVARQGVRDVVSRLAANVQHVHLSSPITGIYTDPTDARLVSVHCDTPGSPTVVDGFHHVIFATQASHAVPILKSYASSLPARDPKRRQLEDQIQCLKTFTYCRTVVINHTDSSLLPDSVTDRRDLNLICLDPESSLKKVEQDDCEKLPNAANVLSPTYTMATHALRPPSGYPAHLPAVYQTTDPIISPKEDCILSVATLERAVLTLESKEALKGLYRWNGKRWWESSEEPKENASQLGSLQGAGKLSGIPGAGVWICGSFAYPGIPLLEGCVVSARNIIEQGVWKCEGVRSTKSPW